MIDTNLYYSFLYKFDNVSQLPTDGSAYYIIGVNRQNSGVTSLTTYHWLLFARNAAGSAQVGVCKYNVTANTYGATNWCTTNLASGQTFLVVVKQHIIAGAANPDRNDLWINPPTNTFGLGEESLPPPAASTTDGTDDSSTAGPGRFHIVCSPASAELDELRIATTWAEVTIPKGTCFSATIFSSPTNVTQSAEISATFRVDPGTTAGPTFQWQISKDSGNTWNGIPGAEAAIYITPNLFIATDQGNQYRAIVTAVCDGSSATSGVATVTLTTPTPTGDGVIMHDQFTDGLRDDSPVTQSNSVWYTAINGSGYLDASSGDLVGFPLHGTSSLWLGFFRETNMVPVHLDVGKQIDITLPFIPDSFFSHTNNGALRFGLFDYYDGGLRPTADASTLSGSGGQGAGVRGYMLSVDFGTNFTANSPLSLLVRTGLGDNNLMGTTDDYLPLGVGPPGASYSNAPAFQASTRYTLVFSVTRTGTNSVNVRAAISGGGTNWTCSVSDVDLAYHRFDAFGIRPNSLETAADSFTIPEFKVEVVGAPQITNQPTDLALTAGGTATFSVGVRGAAPLAYQWRYNTTNLLEAATNSTLILTNLLVENAGLYAVSVTNASGSALSANARLTVNLVPAPLGTLQDRPVTSSVAKLLAMNQIHASYPLSLSSMSATSANGGAIALSNDQFTYTPPAAWGGQDTFSYTVTNHQGCSANGNIVVTITPANSEPVNKAVSITSVGNGWLLSFAGIPGRSYIVQAAAAVAGPWSDVSGPVVSDPTGLISFTDYTTPPPATRFYRIRTATTP